MKTMKYSCILFLFFLMKSCGENLPPSQLFEIQLQNKKSSIKNGETIGITILNKKQKEMGTVTYTLDGETLPISNNKITINTKGLGRKSLKANFSYNDAIIEISKDIIVLSNKAPEVYTYSIVNTYPHDTKAYTQGLEFNEGFLYESTGKVGASTLRKVDFETGEILQKIDLDPKVFGEGLTILDDKIFLLTWQSGVGYVYDKDSFEQTSTFNYGESKQGWGLANDGQKLFKSDGTEKIWFLDPTTLAEEGHLEIATNTSLFNRANELEFVDGKLYANVYGKESMMILDANSGAIEGVINFGGLKDKVKKDGNWDDANSVLNGVAYHPERDTFFVTGKNWDTLFEVNIIKKMP
ncbi:Glutamine cyclotransferase [Croceitalea dokdonensis DOKDO 023]|uniref:Glutamine cyclotransferase n=1 Tax=Croceitalea dokdonensis DOKDO 023 TaxID=1300341 RepID=A0A0P7B4J2_9FLAO|nr:glutaminyl-peptide cyclotransferase [Croceitalea dokdonensis]KPM33640.1 Glutamine cyclotransferase [Croceitalea dokdonensis DOKDO 023]